MSCRDPSDVCLKRGASRLVLVGMSAAVTAVRWPAESAALGFEEAAPPTMSFADVVAVGAKGLEVAPASDLKTLCGAE